MTQKELEEIKNICEAELNSAVNKLKEYGINVRDTQYHLGRKHAATDILHKIEQIKVSDESITK